MPGQTTPHQDLKTNYFAQRTWFFGLLCLLLVVSLLKDVVLSGHLPDALNLGFHALFFAGAAAALLTTKESYHRIWAWLSLVLLSTYILLLFAELPISRPT